jgi:O-acetyl-ADP-ribose deacetylase (regulator of RNase III)
LLASCYRRALELSAQYQILSLAFPNISTGVYHFPKKEACQIALKTVSDYLLASPVPSLVYFVCFDKENYELYNDYLME